MPTECSAELFEFAPVEGRRVVAAFDGGTITSDAGALLLGGADRAIRLTERFASCFFDTHVAALVEHSQRAGDAAGVWHCTRLRGRDRSRRTAARSGAGDADRQAGSAAVGLRRLRQHWGPINRKEAELRTDADNVYKQVQQYLESVA